jgi:hypothetical protein
MKSIATKLISLMGLVFLWAGTGHAQQTILTTKVPFEFTVGNRTLPAGDYRVVLISPDVLSLRDAEGSTLATIVTTQAISFAKPLNAKLMFKVENGRYALSQLWTGDSTIGYQLWVSQPMKVVARNQPESTTKTALVSER